MKYLVTGVKYVLLILVTLISLIPFVMMICMSTHTTFEINLGMIYTIGDALMENIQTLSQTSYGTYYFNSFYIAVVSTLLSLLISCLCGYGLAVYRFKLRKLFFTIIMATMMVPTQVGMIGFIMEMRALGLNNTHIPVIFYAVAWPFGVFWVRQFAQKAIPVDCLESARLEGCGEWRIFFSIGIPFLLPAIASLSMIAFITSWNAFLMPMMVLNDASLYTLQLGIRALGDAFHRDIAAQIAGLSLGVVPILLVFKS